MKNSKTGKVSSMFGTKQVISAQRVAEYGEVLTAEREIEAMLDLVSAEAV